MKYTEFSDIKDRKFLKISKVQEHITYKGRHTKIHNKVFFFWLCSVAKKKKMATHDQVGFILEIKENLILENLELENRK